MKQEVSQYINGPSPPLHTKALAKEGTCPAILSSEALAKEETLATTGVEAPCNELQETLDL